MPELTETRSLSRKAAPDTQPQAPAGARRAPSRKRGRPRREDVEQLDRDLLRHALDHFLDKGFEGATLNAITASLGMSKRTVYARYGDKTALFRAALQTATDEWLEPLTHLDCFESEDFERTLNDIARVVVTTLLSPSGLRLIRITNAESFRNPEIARLTYGRAHRKIAQHLSELFRRRMFAGEAGEAELEELATAFLNLMSGPARVSAWGLEGSNVDVDEFVRQRVRLFLRGAMPHRE